MRLSSTISAFLLTVSAASFVLFPEPVSALDFPFDAIVNTEETLVWSGTSGEDKDYATMKLRRGDKVRVLHQEFGGWYKIAPPDGSFSWIRDDLIDRTAQQGVVKDDTMAIIGSEIGSPKFEVRNLLRAGEVVEILTQAEQLEQGPQRIPMLRIKPPRGEFRFIRQRDVVPADKFVAGREASSTAVLPGENEINPFAESRPDPFKPGVGAPERNSETPRPQPVVAGSSLPGELPGGASFDLARTGPQKETVGALPGSAAEGISMKRFGFEAPSVADPTVTQMTDAEKQQVDAAWARLKSLDQEFQEMRRKPVAEWEIDRLQRGYRALEKTPDSFVRRQVERRLAGLKRYEVIYREIAEVQDLLRRTEEKDEALRQSYLSRGRTVAATPPTRTTVRPAPSGPPQVQTPSPPGATPVVRQPARKPRFDGAGIIQRATTPRGGARHVLLGLDGRILSYLQASPGINLDQFVGQAMGLNGPRQFRRDLGTDFMVVRQMMRVRLRP